MNILTFDLEDWFHILDHNEAYSIANWGSFESRVVKMTMLLLDELSKRNCKVTFFVVGWIAEQYPDLISEIVNRGHEIGSHSYAHELVYQQSKHAFRCDIRKSIDIIENITQRKVNAFRAPGFSILNDTMWAFEIMIEEGITIDASLFSANRSHGGVSGYNYNQPLIVKTKSGVLKEFPMSYINLAGLKYVFTGGGYLRITPKNLINYFCSKSCYNMFYLHPRDFDEGQPRIEDLGPIRKLKHYVGISTTMTKLHMILALDPLTISTACQCVDWQKAPILQVS